MGRPPESAKVITMKGCSHRTKAELEQREKHERATLSKIAFKEKPEVKNNERAHQEFLRIKKLMIAIEKYDGLYENAINRYCQLFAECMEFEEKRETFYDGVVGLEVSWANGELKDSEYYTLRTKMQGQIISLDKQVMSKRNMMLAIEKEHLMTIASALRSVPKKQEKKKDADDDLFS